MGGNVVAMLQRASRRLLPSIRVRFGDGCATVVVGWMARR
jgi:hypothetical protein